MNIWSEVMKALRGGMDELGASMQSQQAIELLGEQIRQVTRQLQQEKESLAQMLITSKQAEQQLKTLQSEIDKFEGYAVKALALEHDEGLALEVAEQIAILESELIKQKSIESDSREQCDLLRQQIRQKEQDILRLKHQRDTIKASTSVQTAQENMTVPTADNKTKPQTARDVLERLKQRQSQHSENKEDNLHSRLKKAGILDNDSDEVVSASQVLKRIKGQV